MGHGAHRLPPHRPVLLLAAATGSPRGRSRHRRPEGATLLQQRCQLYFEFLGRTGAGQEDTFNQDPFGMGYCAGLVRGVVIAAQSFMPDRVCVPRGTTIAQVVRRMHPVSWKQHPQERGELDVELVLRALEDRFRCP